MALDAKWTTGNDPGGKRLTWLLVAPCLLGLTCLVLGRHGNLAWDDADYLRRALANTRLAAECGSPASISRSVDLLLKEEPKPPFLVAWLMLGTSIVGRHRLDALIAFGSVLPFGLLALATIALARRYHGSRAGPLAFVLLAASPRTLEFGGKVMVETFLALWVLLALACASELLVRPSRKVGAMLGLVCGLALLTKLSAALLLGGAVVMGLGMIWRERERDLNRDRQHQLRSVRCALLVCLAVAGPWYARNLPAAVRFGVLSSRFNIDVEGRSAIVPPIDRLSALIADLPGWPMTVILAVAGVYSARLWWMSRTAPEAAGPTVERLAVARLFSVFTVLCALTAGGILMLPQHFDSRFLLPLWPALAVALSGPLAWMIAQPADHRRRFVMRAALAGSLGAAVIGLIREPVATTCWDARALIDELVARHGVSSLANVGNTENWNVCKTGLVNELRDNPDDCFVLHDLSAAGGEELRSRLGRFDAVVVLEPSAFPPGFQQAVPALNRGYSAIAQVLGTDPELIRAADLPRRGLPPLACYVRRRGYRPIQIAGTAPRKRESIPSRLK